MVLDTSAVMAVLLSEPGSDELAATLEAAGEVAMSAATYAELAIVVEARKGPAGTRILDQLLDEHGVEIVPFDAHMARLAAAGWRRFGKGRHRAALNLGDCFAYALATARGEPLLFVGDDFTATDVEPARPTAYSGKSPDRRRFRPPSESPGQRPFSGR